MAKKLLVKEHIKSKYEALHAKHNTTTQDQGEEAETGIMITLDKARLENRRGKELHHTHTFGEEHCVDSDEDVWEKACTQCGFILTFEKI